MRLLQSIITIFFQSWIGGFLTALGLVILGIASVDYYLRPKKRIAPSVIGLNLAEAVSCASNEGIFVVCHKTIEDDRSAPYTIIAQQPIAGTALKGMQPIYVTVTVVGKQGMMPDVVGKQEQIVVKQLQDAGALVKVLPIVSTQPKGVCLAHSVPVGKPIRGVTVYIVVSAGGTTYRIVPSVIGCSLKEVQEITAVFDMSIIVDVDTGSDTVTQQYPSPGTIVDMQELSILHVAL